MVVAVVAAVAVDIHPMDSRRTTATDVHMSHHPTPMVTHTHPPVVHMDTILPKTRYENMTMTGCLVKVVVAVVVLINIK